MSLAFGRDWIGRRFSRGKSGFASTLAIKMAISAVATIAKAK